MKDALLDLGRRVALARPAVRRARLTAAHARRERRLIEQRAQAALDRATARRPRARPGGRTRTLTVPADRLLLGGDGAGRPEELVRLTGDLARPSQPLARWPHDAADGAESAAAPVRVVAVKRSDCFMVLSGHRRAALAHAAGADELDVELVAGSRWTPFAHVVLDMGWLDSRAELYQPVASPEFERWPVVRACRDRLEDMVDFLSEHGPAPGSQASYLDVASCYGWFVAQMLERGYDARGIELERVAPQIGAAAYGLDASRIAVGDSVVLLESRAPADVVSCFSLAHHFVLGRGSCSAEELVGLLARRTRRVLFFEMGQEHEAWFRHSLAGWDADGVRTWLLRHTDFDEVVAIGVDQDSRPPYEDNYGRTLFACVRRRG
ncbi:MAG: hypothetical protein QOG56_2239 [Solirubrobacteraceae bacterium]|nr:hypothetical protein [Solirubrobacteraceae bacterium]